MHYLKKNDLNISESPITPINLGDLIKLIVSDKISGKIAKEVFEEMFLTKKSPIDIVDQKDLSQLNNSDEIEIIIEKIFQENQDKVEQYKNGKTKLLTYFIGQAMKKTKGKANPKILNDLILSKLTKN